MGFARCSSTVVLCTLFWYKVDTLFCQSPQYLELEKTGIINCAVDETYFGIYWYNSTDSRKNTPLLSREGSNVGGAVYPSDEFQLLENGSLSITYVSLQHEHNFRIVLVVNRELGLIEKRDIQVTVIAKPLHDHPLISNCGNQRGCLVHVDSIMNLKCIVDGSRPLPVLKWVSRTWAEDLEYPSDSSFTLGQNWFTVTSEITVALLNSTLLMVCKSLEPPMLLKYSESFIVIENSDEEAPLANNTSVKIERGSQMLLKCADNRTTFLKWERELQEGTLETIALAIFGQPFYSKVDVGRYDVGSDGSLIVDNIKPEDEGIFTCLTGDGYKNERKSFIVKVFAHPTTPVVEGCSQSFHCALDVSRQGRLNCSLYNIRPVVQLEWVVLTNQSDEAITFYSHHHSTTDYNDGTFGVHLTAEFSVSASSPQTVKVACKAKTVENVSYELDLLINDDILPTTILPNEVGKFSLLWLIVPLVCVSLAGVAFAWCRAARNRKTTERAVNDQEITPMMELERNFLQATTVNRPSYEDAIVHATSKRRESLNLKDVFIKQLQKKYKLQYEGIRPIPYLREKMYNVRSVFVESTIEVLLRHEKMNDSDAQWERINSYHELLNRNALISSRKIVQADPGYGKTTLTLQMAYDWSTKQSYSPLREKEILILLRLRQLFGLSSIYNAIRLFLLPKDTTITVSDIKEILQQCSSCVIILDGFDEYPHKDGDKFTDINSIIAGDMFQESSVILCTRPLSLPTEIPPGTQRVRLNGFDRTAQEAYVQKAVTDDTDMALKIHTRLYGNPVLRDFCQVPLFFVMFAHMTNENANFQDINSATSFFQHVIRCFHSHLQNKVKDENLTHYKILENDHTNLDELSFQIVTRNEKFIWRKKKFCEHVGNQFYDYYVRLGILCEEEVFDFNSESVSEESYRIEVRFYHQLFCEWYAAHHLARLAENLSFMKFKKVVNKLDLFELHYVFRFACGLNPTAARKILKHLNSVKHGGKFATLCVLEQSGKFSDIKENVSQICSEEIHLNSTDNRVLQRSTIQLMIIAARNEVPISSLWLRNCLNLSSKSEECLQLNTGMSVPRLDTLLRLHVYNEESSITFDEAIQIINFANLSSKIEEVRFHLCLLPQSLDCESVLKNLNERNVKVSWAPDAFGTFFLNRCGQWETKDGTRLSDSAYEKEVLKFKIHV